MKLLLWGALLWGSATILPAAKNLEVYFIDVEGGQATLIVPPGGESLLIDTGWPGHNKRDAERIAAAAKSAGVKKIDYLIVTHFHEDHMGGVAQLLGKLPIRNFVDHDQTVETGAAAQQLFKSYLSYREKGNHIVAKPGASIPVKGLDVKVLSAGGEAISGAGKPNADCSTFQKQAVDASENARSVGVLISFGEFRMLDLGDLTWNKEYDLVCPNNQIGPVDVYVVSHHGTETSGSPQLLRAIAPRVAIMDNGATKGGSAMAWQTVHDTPGLQDLWQLHYSVPGGKAHNSSDTVIANVDEICEGKWIKMTAQRDGSFTVENARNKFSKAYKGRK